MMSPRGVPVMTSLMGVVVTTVSMVGKETTPFTVGEGNDVFVFRRAEETTGTTIEDFTPGSDKIDLSGLGVRLVFSEDGPQAYAVWVVKEEIIFVFLEM